MKKDELFAKEVILSTGDRIPLSKVVGTLLLFEGMIRGAGTDRELLVNFREACLAAKELSAPAQSELVRLGLLNQDGSIAPVIRQITLASIRGENEAISLISPYTNAWDQTISDLMVAREKVRTALPAERAELLISSRDIGMVNTPEELRTWATSLTDLKRPGRPPPSRN